MICLHDPAPVISTGMFLRDSRRTNRMFCNTKTCLWRWMMGKVCRTKVSDNLLRFLWVSVHFCFLLFLQLASLEVSHESFIFTSSTCSFWRGLARTLRFHNFSLQFLKDVSHESCVLQPQLALFEGVLAQKLRFHNLNLQFLKEVLHKSFVFTTSTCSVWKKSRAKCAFER